MNIVVRENVWRTLKKRRIIMVDNAKIYCHICDLPINPNIYSGYLKIEGIKRRHPLSGTKDHVIPKKLGGTNEVENLKPAHNHCNISKNARFIGSGNEKFKNEKRRIILKLMEYPIDELWTSHTYCYMHKDKRSIVIIESLEGTPIGVCQKCYKANKKGTCRVCGKDESERYMSSTTICDSCYSRQVTGVCKLCNKTEGNFKSKTICYSCYSANLKGVCEICGKTSQETRMKTKTKCNNCFKRRIENISGNCLMCNKHSTSVLKYTVICKNCDFIRKLRICEICNKDNTDGQKFTTKTKCKNCYSKEYREKRKNK